MALSTQPYKGARDFYPEDKRVQKYMFNILRSVAERYGYEEYDAPILEPLEIYTAKSGEEIVNEQTYTFEDRGGRQVVIRPEMTPTVSRMVAARRQELGYPLRWYSIPNLWRYERPQRGRLREHWQLNVDIFGVATMAAETEIITVINDMFKQFGATSNMYRIKVNSRQLINYLLRDHLELSEKQAHEISKLIDRMNKMDREQFIAKTEAVLGAEAKVKGTTETLMTLLACTSIIELPQSVQELEYVKELQTVLSQLEKNGITNATFDLSLMRGFDYYTGIVFEVFDTHPDNNRSMLGGGRYDGLVGLFGVDPVPTVGFGWGDVTLQNFLEIHSLMPELSSETNLYVVLVGDMTEDAQPVIAEFRSNGITVAVDLSGRKIGDQLKTASKKNITHAIVIGESEIQGGTYTCKNLDTGEEMSGNVDVLSRMLNSYARN
ncbi:MAG: histidine--tRNA ligase [Patescibacteria group bacterium]|nr:histidine--tRNA ligase [Patescibacteria group bacterium]